MTLYKFNSLSEPDQALVIWSGVFIANKEENGFRILLYQVDSFYVEVYYDKENNQINKFRSFASTSQLDPYLKDIDLNGKF